MGANPSIRSTCPTAFPRSCRAAISAFRAGGPPTSWWKEERGSRVFIDYNQNAHATVSMPIDWPELPYSPDFPKMPGEPPRV